MCSSDRPTPPSLRQLTLRQCIRLASSISDIGCARYEIVRPILQRLNGRQLNEIENRCPHIRHQSDDLWRLLIQREFPERVLPPPPYRSAYYALCQDKETQMTAARERLRANQRQYEAQKEASTVVALTEVPQRSKYDVSVGNAVPSYRSRTMQQVVKQMRLSNMRRPPPAILPSAREKMPSQPPPVNVSSRQGSPPRVTRPTSPVAQSRPQPSKRRKVSSIFMPSR